VNCTKFANKKSQCHKLTNACFKNYLETKDQVTRPQTAYEYATLVLSYQPTREAYAGQTLTDVFPAECLCSRQNRRSASHHQPTANKHNTHFNI